MSESMTASLRAQLLTKFRSISLFLGPLDPTRRAAFSEKDVHGGRRTFVCDEVRTLVFPSNKTYECGS